MSLKLHPSYVTDIQSLGLDGTTLSDLWIKSDVQMYSDSECLLVVENPCSMEVINIADLRFKERPTITIMDKDGNELYVDQAMAIDETFGVSTQTNDDRYLLKTGGDINGGVSMLKSPVGFTFPNGQWNNIGDDTRFGDINVANTFGVQSTSNNAIGYVRFGNTTSGATIGTDGTNFTISRPTSAQEISATTITEGGTLLTTKYVQQLVQYTNPTWLAGIDASTIKTGTIDLARLPAMPSANTIVCTTIPAMTSGDQLLVAKGTVVIESTTGNTYRYSGTGSVTLNASYIQQSDLTPDWSVITNRPTNVSNWTNDSGYLTNTTGDSRYYTKTQADAKWLPYSGGYMNGPITMGAGATTSASTLSTTNGFLFDAYAGIVHFNSATKNGVGGTLGPADGPFLYGYGGVALGYTNVTSAGGLVAALKTQGTAVTIAGTLSVGGAITEAGTALSSKYVSLTGSYSDPSWITSLSASKITQSASYRFTTDTEKATWNAKQNAITTGTSAQYFRGDLSLATFPTTWDWVNITSKPTTLAGYGITDGALSTHTHTFASLTSKPTTLSGYGITDGALSTHTHTFASLTSKPTTLSGYGITDAVGSSDARLTDARTPNNNAALVQGNVNNTGAYGKRTTGLGNTALAIEGLLDSGFYDANGTGTPLGNWTHIINSAHINSYSGNQYQFQFAASFDNSISTLLNSGSGNWGGEGYWVRTINTTGKGAWRKLWHDGNFTPGNYLPLAGGTMSGNLLGSTSYNIGASGNWWGNGYFNNLYAQNNLVWHAGNLSNPVTGTGTASYLPVFTGTSSLGNSLLIQDTAWGIVTVKQTPANGQLGFGISNPTTGKAWVFNYRTSDDAFRWGYYNGTAWSADLMCLSTTGNLTLDSGEIYATRLRAKNQGATTSGIVLNTPTAACAGICISGSGTQTTMTFSQVDAVGALIRKSDIAANNAYLDGKITAGNGSTFTGNITVSGQIAATDTVNGILFGGQGRIWRDTALQINDPTVISLRIAGSEKLGINSTSLYASYKITAPEFKTSWGINGAYNFYGPASANTASWGTTGGMGTNGTDTWIGAVNAVNIWAGGNTSIMTATSSNVTFGVPIYSSELHSTVSYAGTGLFAGTGDGASLSTYNQKLTSWYGTGIYDGCNNVCRGYIDHRLGKLYMTGNIETLNGLVGSYATISSQLNVAGYMIFSKQTITAAFNITLDITSPILTVLNQNGAINIGLPNSAYCCVKYLVNTSGYTCTIGGSVNVVINGTIYVPGSTYSFASNGKLMTCVNAGGVWHCSV